MSREIEMRNAYKIMLGKPDGKRPLARPSGRGKLIKCILGI
jgi:hypothetical protein